MCQPGKIRHLSEVSFYFCIWAIKSLIPETLEDFKLAWGFLPSACLCCKNNFYFYFFAEVLWLRLGGGEVAFERVCVVHVCLSSYRKN